MAVCWPADCRRRSHGHSLILRIRQIRNVVRLASFRQRDPRSPQACIMFALLGVVCFLRQRCASGGRFPCVLALGSHLILPISTTSGEMVRAGDCICGPRSFFPRRADECLGDGGGPCWPPPSPSNRRNCDLSSATYRCLLGSTNFFAWRPSVVSCKRRSRAFSYMQVG
jgi:hypothetical protein